jgi:hypothetical protein
MGEGLGCFSPSLLSFSFPRFLITLISALCSLLVTRLVPLVPL